MLVTMGKGGYGAYFTYGCFCLSMYAFAYFLVPETKGKSLEAMDDLFGVIENKFVDEEGGPGGHHDEDKENKGMGVEEVERVESKKN